MMIADGGAVCRAADPRPGPAIQLLQSDLPQLLRHLRQPLSQEPCVCSQRDSGGEQ